jgi:ribosome-associated protein
MDAPTKAAHAARFADDKKAENIIALDLDGICTFTDAFMICTGSTRLQLRAIANGIVEGLTAMGVAKPVMDGERNATWMVLDYGDLIVHIMSHDRAASCRADRRGVRAGVGVCSLPVPRSLAETLRMPLASMSKVTSICGMPRGAGGMPSS